MPFPSVFPAAEPPSAAFFCLPGTSAGESPPHGRRRAYAVLPHTGIASGISSKKRNARVFSDPILRAPDRRKVFRLLFSRFPVVTAERKSLFFGIFFGTDTGLERRRPPLPASGNPLQHETEHSVIQKELLAPKRTEFHNKRKWKHRSSRKKQGIFFFFPDYPPCENQKMLYNLNKLVPSGTHQKELRWQARTYTNTSSYGSISSI